MKSFLILLLMIYSLTSFAQYSGAIHDGDSVRIMRDSLRFHPNLMGIYTTLQDPSIVGVDATAGSIILWQSPSVDEATMFVKTGSANTDWSSINNELNDPAGGGVANLDDIGNVDAVPAAGNAGDALVVSPGATGFTLQTLAGASSTDFANLIDVRSSTSPTLDHLIFGDGSHWINRDTTSYLQGLGFLQNSDLTATDYENIGSGATVFAGVSSQVVQLRSILGVDGIEATAFDNDIQIGLSRQSVTDFVGLGDVANDATPQEDYMISGGNSLWQSRDTTAYLQGLGFLLDGNEDVTDFQNIGGGEGFFESLANSTARFKSLVVQSSLLSLSSDATQVYLDTTASDVTDFVGLGDVANDATPQDDYMIAGSGSLWQSVDTTGYLQGLGFLLSGNESVTDFQNIGNGATVFESVANSTARIKSFIVGGLGVSSLSDASTFGFSLLQEATGYESIGGGATVFAGVANGVAQFKSVVAGTGISLFQDATQVYVSSSGGGGGSGTLESLIIQDDTSNIITATDFVTFNFVGNGVEVRQSSDGTAYIDIPGAGASLNENCCFIRREQSSTFAASGSAGDNIMDITDESGDCSTIGITVDTAADDITPDATSTYRMNGFTCTSASSHGLAQLETVGGAEVATSSSCSTGTATNSTHCWFNNEIITLSPGVDYQINTIIETGGSGRLCQVQNITVDGNIKVDNIQFCLAE